MRLTDNQLQIIKQESAKVFGDDAQVWVFGSRVDDNARGGDIDLLIETDATAEEALDRELALYARLIRRLGDQRIDIVVRRAGTPVLPIHKEALNRGVRL